jgi:hypothetical protein
VAQIFNDFDDAHAPAAASTRGAPDYKPDPPTGPHPDGGDCRGLPGIAGDWRGLPGSYKKLRGGLPPSPEDLPGLQPSPRTPPKAPLSNCRVAGGGSVSDLVSPRLVGHKSPHEEV